MSTAPATPTGPSTKKPALRVPPEDAFWKRYSPHSEFELSAAGSVALHILAIGLVALIAWMAIKLGLGGEDRPLPVETVQFSNLGGGGGEKKSRDEGAGGKDATEEPKERGDPTDDKPVTDKTNAKPPIERPTLTPDNARNIQADFQDSRVDEMLRDATQSFASVANLSRDVREKLRENVNPGGGRGGSGRDGGKDVGKDTGDDKGKGAGKATLNQREKRVLRWAMTFNTQNGVDYARQLGGLNAILALPEGQQFRIIRDFSKRPALGEVEDISSINRIYWVDDKPQSVHSIAQALGWPEGTSYFVAFFPAELEERLLQLEMDAAKKQHPGKNVREDDIHETKFRVINAGGRYDVQVTSVSLRRR
jgi:hypothetical protein